MNQITTTAIVLARTDFGEADRILTVLTPDYGKLRLMARGVRKVKSKLAGGIELFSVSDITFIRGRGDISTLVSSRLQKHYARIVQQLDRTMLGYDLLKLLNRVTEDEPEAEYFHLLQSAFEALDETAVPLDLTRLWFQAQLLKLAGHSPNLQTDDQGGRLMPEATYNFNAEAMAFGPAPRGRFTSNHIKFLRLLFSANPAATIAKVQGSEMLATELTSLVAPMVNQYLQH